MARVLFLEDDKALAENIPILLKREGLDAVGTTSIAQALEWFAQEDFDAVLLDIMMTPAKDMDAEALDYGRKTGVAVAQRMKEIKPGVPIVAFTVVNDSEVKACIREIGVSRILSKDAENTQIADALWQVIRGRV